MTADLERFYSLIGEVACQSNQDRPLAEYSGRFAWPSRGVYFFREPGESRTAYPERPRIVRVGTHAVSAGAKSTLWGRLRAHRGHLSGGGNHRGSIFRLHVGAALIGRDGFDMPTWGQGSSAPKPIRFGETIHEQRVSAYIGTMSVLWVEVPDEAGPMSARATIERNSIALLSNGMTPVDEPSQGWLGRYSPADRIRQSGLWNLNHVDEEYDPAFLDLLESFVERLRHTYGTG